MKSERERQLDFGFNLPEIHEDKRGIGVHNIPSDDDSQFTLNVFLSTYGSALGDVFVQMSDSATSFITGKRVDLPDMRLRCAIGGGLNPFIAEELSSLPGLFRYYNGHIPEDFKLSKTRQRLNPHSSIEVEYGMNKNEPKLSIRNIQDDDEQFDELTKFMDIEIANNGNVTLAQRHIRHEPDSNTWLQVEKEGRMLFKTKKNGGEYPLVAEVFTRIAKRIANASRLPQPKDS